MTSYGLNAIKLLISLFVGQEPKGVEVDSYRHVSRINRR